MPLSDLVQSQKNPSGTDAIDSDSSFHHDIWLHQQNQVMYLFLKSETTFFQNMCPMREFLQVNHTGNSFLSDS